METQSNTPNTHRKSMHGEDTSNKLITISVTIADDRSTWRALRPTAGYAQQWLSISV